MAIPTIPLAFDRLSPDEGRARVRALLASLRRRRSVRDFAADPVPLDVVETAIEAAASAGRHSAIARSLAASCGAAPAAVLSK